MQWSCPNWKPIMMPSTVFLKLWHQRSKKLIYLLLTTLRCFHLILFLTAINLVASVYDAAFPAMMLSRNGGSEKVLGMVNAGVGVCLYFRRDKHIWELEQ